MAIEARGGRLHYYYRKRKVAGRVISEYMGSGEVGFWAAKFDYHARLERERARRQAREAAAQQRAADAELDCYLDDVVAAVRDYLRVCLIAGGFHLHKGQWRRTRTKRT